MRLLRTLRPLRLIKRNKNMRLVVSALIDSASSIGNILLILLLVQLMFGIFGVAMMRNRLWYCNFPPQINYPVYEINQQMVFLIISCF
jgi:hypothetical protein